MATLNNGDLAWIAQYVKSVPAVYVEFRLWGLSRANYLAAIQACETYMVGAFATRPAGALRAAIEAVTGATTSARAQAVIRVWAAWKMRTG